VTYYIILNVYNDLNNKVSNEYNCALVWGWARVSAAWVGVP